MVHRCHCLTLPCSGASQIPWIPPYGHIVEDMGFEKKIADESEIQVYVHRIKILSPTYAARVGMEGVFHSQCNSDMGDQVVGSSPKHAAVDLEEAYS